MRHTPAAHFEADHSPEAALLTTVVETAILDARYGDRDAWAFLTAGTGDWRRSPDYFVALLGFDPARLRRHVLATMTPPGEKPKPRVTREVTDYCPRPGSNVARIFDAMQGRGRMMTEEVASATGLPHADIASAFGALHKKGLIRRLAMRVYSVPP